ncbi:peptide deformylase 1 [Streptomyces olivaceoviridis]|uniref:peptide deformylase n=1 Tax=Streptomyces olivaceoviridis TaxID=1921 RepID=UPI0016776F8A|nr:peptide deformylase [Streptomyces olivaceoviridis]GGZ28054.1 peptide deformylase 1 [Streptomyces olivaceoviridis]
MSSPQPTPALLTRQVEELLQHGGPLPIVAAGDPVLRRIAEPYDGQLDDALLDRFVAALRETMHAAPGVGLAAPQVGVPLSIAVIEDKARGRKEALQARDRAPLPFRVLVNPVYEPEGEARAAFFEGCLSVPGWQAVTARYARVRLRGQDERGQAVDEVFTGWAARIVQHETDHLNGTLYLDVAESRSLSTDEAVAAHWSQPTAETAAEVLGFELP